MISNRGTITSQDGSFAEANQRGDLWLFVEVAGTAGIVLLFEHSSDGVTWTTVGLEKMSDRSLATGYTLSASEDPPLFWYKKAFGRRLRVRATTLSSGSASVEFHAPGMSWYKLLRPTLGVYKEPYIPGASTQPPVPGVPVAALF